MKQFQVDHEIQVKAPVEKVFQVWSDFEHFAELYPEVYDRVIATRHGNVVDTEEVIKTIAGKQQATIHTTLDPPRRYVREFQAGAMEGSVRTTTFEAASDGTLVKTHMDVKLGGMAAMLIGDLAETLFTKNLDKLSKAHAAIAESD